MPNTQKIIDATLSPAEQDLLLQACINWAQNTVDVPGAQLISKIQQLNQAHDSLDKTVQRILANEVQRLQTELLAVRALFEPLFGAQPHLDVHTGQWALGTPTTTPTPELQPATNEQYQHLANALEHLRTRTHALRSLAGVGGPVVQLPGV